LNDIHIIDLENMHWITPITGGSVPPPIFNHFSFAYHFEGKDEIVVLGGVKSDNEFNGS